MRNDDWMSAYPGNYQWFGNPPPFSTSGEQSLTVENGSSKRITINKRTHRIRFENETESQVTIVIEGKNVTE